LQEGPEIEASLCCGDACVDWVITCKQPTNPNPPLTTAEQWAEYFRVGHLVEDQDLRKIHGWVYEYNSSGQLECVPVESDWMLINDPYITVHWEFVDDPPDLTVPGTYFLKAIFANDSIPDPILCNPCVCPDGTENCEACQECPARKKPTIRDPDVERLFTIWVVETEIIWPKTPRLKSQEFEEGLAASFLTDGGCYRQSRDAVVIGARGDIAQKRLARVEGEISPSVLDPWWDIPFYLGDISYRYHTKPKNPGHIPPAEPDHGGISFLGRYLENPVCSDSVGIRVYFDHLSRDMCNFWAGRWCSPASRGIELIDGTFVVGKTMTCGMSVSHADDGKTDGLEEIQERGYTTISWPVFTTSSFTRGDVFNLMLANPNHPPTRVNLHWCTVVENDPGMYATTFAGDSWSRVFRQEDVRAYYHMVWNDLITQYNEDQNPYKEPHPYIEGYTSLSFNTWIQDCAQVDVYRVIDAVVDP